MAHDLSSGVAILRGGAALTPLPDRRLLRLRGEDRVRFLQGMLANDVAALSAGEGRYALLLTEQGRVVGDLRVLALDAEMWIDVARERAEAVQAALERFLVADDVEIDALDLEAVALRGSGAGTVVAAIAGSEFAGLPEGAHAPLPEGGEGSRVARIRDVGVDGFLLWAPAAALSSVEAKLLEGGAERVGADAVETLRILGGWAREGVDFDDKTLAPEVPSLARAISYRKGCYLGQEVVERVAARGHVNWLVMRLEGEGTPPAVGSLVSENGTEVGRVSSSASAGGGRCGVLARIRRTAATVGHALAIGEAATPFLVAETPAP